MRRVIFNQKGGVGKSTITCNLAAINASRGRRTLVVDLDPQCNASQYLLCSDDRVAEHSIADFFSQTLKARAGAAGLADCVTPTPFDNLDLVASDPDLDDLQVKLEARQKIYKLRDALMSLSGYDDIFIDTPPALHFFTRAALIAAERCLIPFDCDDFSRQALYNLLDTVEEICADHNAGLRVEGIVVNQFLPRARLPQKLVEELKAEGQPVLEPYLGSSVVVKESHDASVPLIHHAPKHKLTGQYVALFEALRT